MTPAEVRAKIANLVTELDTLIDNHEDVSREARHHINRAANELAEAYIRVPGRFQREESKV